MAKNPYDAIFFDIETGGKMANASSIVSLSFKKHGQEQKNIFADLVQGSYLYHWSKRNTWEEVRKEANRISEQELLDKWIKTLTHKDNVGKTLVGWNIGYDIVSQSDFGGSQGFDIGFTLRRAQMYGMEKELAAAYQGMKIRDLGREYSVMIAEQVKKNLPYLRDKIDPAILESTLKYADMVEEARGTLPKDASYDQIARRLSMRKSIMTGWKQESIVELLGMAGYKAHTLEDVTTGSRIPDPEYLRQLFTEDPKKLVLWGDMALRNSLLSQAMEPRSSTPPKNVYTPTGDGRFERTQVEYAKPTDYIEELRSRAKARNITDFDTKLEKMVAEAGGDMSRVARGLGVIEGRDVVNWGTKSEFGARLAAFDMSKVPLERIGLGVGAIAGVALLANIAGSFSGFDDEYNTIEGLGHEGIAGRLRKINTDFGSGWQGLPSSLHGQPIDPRILHFRASVWDDMDARSDFQAELELRQNNHNRQIGSFQNADLFRANTSVIKGIAQRNKDLKVVRLANFKVNVEDADTLVLSRRGIAGWFENDIQVRLAGIDAPEVAGHEGDPLDFIRMWQGQPGGEEASQLLRDIMADQENAKLLIDTERKTYGRYLGAVIGDQGQNINLQLVREGAVTALPFGESEFDILSRGAAAEAQAAALEERRGIWQLKRYQAIATANKAIGRPLTHNMLTRVDKMASNLNVGAYSSFLEDFGYETGELTAQEMARARGIGRALRRTHGPGGYKGTRFSGKDDAWNTIEGLGHEGIAWQIRQQMTDFGSGFAGLKRVFADMIDVPISKIVRAMPEHVAANFAQRLSRDVIESNSGELFAVGGVLAEGGMGVVRNARSLRSGERAVYKTSTYEAEEMFATINKYRVTPQGGARAMATQIYTKTEDLRFGLLEDFGSKYKSLDTQLKDAKQTAYDTILETEPFIRKSGEVLAEQTDSFSSSMKYEANRQAMAHADMPKNVPAVLGETDVGFFSQYAGRPLKDKEMKEGVEFLDKTFKSMMRGEKSVAHLDFHIDQVLKNTKTGELQLVDFGISVATHGRPVDFLQEANKAIDLQLHYGAAKAGLVKNKLFEAKKVSKKASDLLYPKPKLTIRQRAQKELRRIRAHAEGVRMASMNAFFPGKRHRKFGPVAVKHPQSSMGVSIDPDKTPSVDILGDPDKIPSLISPNRFKDKK